MPAFAEFRRKLGVGRKVESRARELIRDLKDDRAVRCDGFIEHERAQSRGVARRHGLAREARTQAKERLDLVLARAGGGRGPDESFRQQSANAQRLERLLETVVVTDAARDAGIFGKRERVELFRCDERDVVAGAFHLRERRAAAFGRRSVTRPRDPLEHVDRTEGPPRKDRTIVRA